MSLGLGIGLEGPNLGLGLGFCCLSLDYRFDGPSCEDTVQQSCAMVRRWRFFGDFFASCICSEPCAARFRPASEIRAKATPRVEV